MELVVCIKQVPMVSELPWDPATGTLKRELAEGMMNPACRHALEAALQLKARQGGRITAVTMGPPMAEEVLRQALALGADEGLLLSDPAMAGADTFITSRILAKAVKQCRPDFDLILCGCYTSDSETAQVGPQLAEELDLPSAAFVEEIDMKKNRLIVSRFSDGFIETLEMKLPGLVTVSTQCYTPRYFSLAGIEAAFPDGAPIRTVRAGDLGLDPESIGVHASPTRILKVYAAGADKENIVLRGAPKQIVDHLLNRFGDRIGGAMGKDIKKNRN
ncbi:MAG: electron transfer flavoprotein subunit beta/FixA family protein [Deltaproteobacteria bacterium]|nr:electron transfer flavoprotein subunit beta/FixA family protein [Deltaproteobacteria bacterium]